MYLGARSATDSDEYKIIPDPFPAYHPPHLFQWDLESPTKSFLICKLHASSVIVLLLIANFIKH